MVLESRIEPVPVSITWDSSSDPVLLYHLFIDGGDSDYAFNSNGDDHILECMLFPGVYDLYLYGMSQKSETTVSITSWSKQNIVISHGVPADITTTLQVVDITGSLEINGKSSVHLAVPCQDLDSIFSLSSLSVKQGSDRVRRVEAEYDENHECWGAVIPVSRVGIWSFNISLQPCNLYDDKVIEYSGYRLSTTYIKNIPLGEVAAK
jgi:hypothetical protein